MGTVLIVIHLMVVVALVAVVLLQRSEGGALGIGGGGGGGGFMTARGAGNALTRVTAILAAAFFATSLALGVLAKYEAGSSSILNRIQSESSEQGGGNGILDALRPEGAPEIPLPLETEPEIPTPTPEAPATPPASE